MSGLMVLVASWSCWISYKNGYARLAFSLAASFEPLAHCQNVANLSFFYIQVPLPYSRGRSTRWSDRLHFSVAILRCYKDVYVNSFLPPTARLWNFLPIECFPLTCDLNDLKSRINRHLLIGGSFWTNFLNALTLLCLFFL